MHRLKKGNFEKIVRTKNTYYKINIAQLLHFYFVFSLMCLKLPAVELRQKLL